VRRASLWLLLIWSATPAAAQTDPRDGPGGDVPVLRALQIDDGVGLHLDGALDEPVWQRAARITGFRQQEPLEGEPASEDTEVRVLYDGAYLYIGVRAFDSEPDRIVARQLERDASLGVSRFGPSGTDDAVEIILDTFHDRRNAYYFATNPQGVLSDGLITDESFDPASQHPLPRPGRRADLGFQRAASGRAQERTKPLDRLVPGERRADPGESGRRAHGTRVVAGRPRSVCEAVRPW
jgi:hypothetical protein